MHTQQLKSRSEIKCSALLISQCPGQNFSNPNPLFLKCSITYCRCYSRVKLETRLPQSFGKEIEMWILFQTCQGVPIKCSFFHPKSNTIGDKSLSGFMLPIKAKLKGVQKCSSSLEREVHEQLSLLSLRRDQKSQALKIGHIKTQECSFLFCPSNKTFSLSNLNPKSSKLGMLNKVSKY